MDSEQQGSEDTASDPKGGDASRDRLAPDAATLHAARKPSEAVVLEGYLGEGESDQYRHLYRDLGLEVFLRIPVEAIIDRFSDSGNDLTKGKSVVMIDPRARLLLCQAVRVLRACGPDKGLADHPWPYPFGSG